MAVEGIKSMLLVLVLDLVSNDDDNSPSLFSFPFCFFFPFFFLTFFFPSLYLYPPLSLYCDPFTEADQILRWPQSWHCTRLPLLLLLLLLHPICFNPISSSSLTCAVRANCLQGGKPLALATYCMHTHTHIHLFFFQSKQKCLLSHTRTHTHLYYT